MGDPGPRKRPRCDLGDDPALAVSLPGGQPAPPPWAPRGPIVPPQGRPLAPRGPFMLPLGRPFVPFVREQVWGEIFPKVPS